MKKDWKYIVYIAAAILVYLVFSLMAPRQLDWRITFHRSHKIPFGGYALNELIHDLFPEKQIMQSNYTIYELYDTITKPVNFISISTDFSPPDDDVLALLKNVSNGGSAFISAHNFYGKFADTLKISSQDYYFEDEHRHFLTDKEDSSRLLFTNTKLQNADIYRYPRKNIHERFILRSDSLHAKTVAENDIHLPVTLIIPWGKGKVIVNCTPMAFTNAYLLPENNSRFAATTLSYLPVDDVVWTEYYHLGRMEAQTPLRFILSNEALRWAYFITILSLLVFIIFEAKRKQRIIPVIKPLGNTTLEFVRTIGNLYYQQGEHKDLAEKKISYLFDQIRTKYWLSTNKLDDNFIVALSRKSGKPEEDVRAMIMLIRLIQSQRDIAVDRLIDLNEKIEKFNSHL
ncbi:MAG TPA: DUF4350 domain-containing protein [Ohtaekwangia sp.]|uniref:DUF4350 domain-containing protein n=1 Tax=Ohtaekwangia sp. TaxID=2066019 RepID=UPI002F91E1A6